MPDIFYGRHLLSLVRVLPFDRPVVAEVHAPPANPLAGLIERRLLGSPRLERLVTVSAALRREYLHRFPELSPDRVVVSHNAAAPRLWDGPPRPPGGRASAPRVGYAGHLYPGKGIELLDRLAREMPHVDFHVFGGTASDLRRWRRMAPHANLLLHGHLPPADLPAALAAFAIVVAPYQRKVSVSGGGDVAEWMSPLKLFECMAQGKAVVASDLPVLREVLKDGENGIVCDPDAPAAWCAAIQRLIDAPHEARELGRRARETVLARHTWEQRAAAVLGQQLREVVNA